MPEISDSSPLKWPMALLFDMDLTLIRSRHFWRAAEQTLLEHLGLNPQMDVHHCYNGMHAIDAGKAMHKLLQPALSADECVRVFREALIKQFQTQPPGDGTSLGGVPIPSSPNDSVLCRYWSSEVLFDLLPNTYSQVRYGEVQPVNSRVILSAAKYAELRLGM